MLILVLFNCLLQEFVVNAVICNNHLYVSVFHYSISDRSGICDSENNGLLCVQLYLREPNQL